MLLLLIPSPTDTTGNTGAAEYTQMATDGCLERKDPLKSIHRCFSLCPDATRQRQNNVTKKSTEYTRLQCLGAVTNKGTCHSHCCTGQRRNQLLSLHTHNTRKPKEHILVTGTQMSFLIKFWFELKQLYLLHNST